MKAQTNNKTYIGSGKQVKDLDIVEISICMDDAEQLIHEYEGKKYLTVQVAKRKEPSKFGKTHTVYHWKPEPQVAE